MSVWSQAVLIPTASWGDQWATVLACAGRCLVILLNSDGAAAVSSSD